tara:strand:- start:80 stop:349 length:270 start_codon:yes stop_codon:yes gene_type:complete
LDWITPERCRSFTGAAAGEQQQLCRSVAGPLPVWSRSVAGLCRDWTRKAFRMLWILGADLDSLELLPLVRMHLDPGVLHVGVKGERVNP